MMGGGDSGDGGSLKHLTLLAMLEPKSQANASFHPSLLYLATYDNKKAKIVNSIQNSAHILHQSKKLFFGKLETIIKFYRRDAVELCYIGKRATCVCVSKKFREGKKLFTILDTDSLLWAFSCIGWQKCGLKNELKQEFDEEKYYNYLFGGNADDGVSLPTGTLKWEASFQVAAFKAPKARIKSIRAPATIFCMPSSF